MSAFKVGYFVGSLSKASINRKLSLALRFAEPASLGELLTRSSCASSLRILSVIMAGRVSFADARFERLEQLTLEAYEIHLAGLSAPSLRSLSVEFSMLPTKLESCFTGLDTPVLEHFQLTAHVHDYWDHHSGPLQSHLADTLHLPAFSRLRSLTLRTKEGSLPYHRGLAQLFARMPARPTLERIDLREAALGPEARAELEAARSSLPELLLAERA